MNNREESLMTDLQEQILKVLGLNPTISLSVEKIGRLIKKASADDFTPLVQSLAKLEREGLVEVTDQGEFKLVPQQEEIVGVFHANPKGFGFVAYDDDLPDIY